MSLLSFIIELDASVLSRRFSFHDLVALDLQDFYFNVRKCHNQEVAVVWSHPMSKDENDSSILSCGKAS